MKADATTSQIDHVIDRIKEMGYKPHPIYGEKRTIVAAVGDERGKYRLESLLSLPAVEQVVPILKPYKLVGREIKPEPSVFEASGVKIGTSQFALISGPCSVESREQINETAHVVKEAGANMLRGGAFKPRSSPYSFQGLEEEGLMFLKDAADSVGLPVVTEVITIADIDLVADYADILQIGARNMMNFALLKAAGRVGKPILLKRGMMAKIEDLLMSAEYILSEGNDKVILCERGIRTFEPYTRNTLDLSAVPLLKELSHLPVIVDPSHGTGVRSLVSPMCKAAVAAGADGLTIEVHPNPEEAFSDGDQSLLPDQFIQLVRELKPYLDLAGLHL